MSSSATAASHQPPPETDPARLPALLHQAVADLTDPAVSYLLGGHYYERTNHPRTRHFPAVFALRQAEVRNVEVGPDYLAFDTEFMRYDEGEAQPRADRFRTTISFAQLYQVCRKLLTRDELRADSVSYGPETVVYYDAALHRNYPIPADINQTYVTAPAAGAEHPLVAVLAVIAAGLPDPANHYVVNTTSFDSPAGPVLLGTLHLHADAVGALDIAEEAFSCEVLLDLRDRRQKSVVRVPYAHVWQVLQGNSPNLELSKVIEAGGLLYGAPDVLRDFTQSGRPV